MGYSVNTQEASRTPLEIRLMLAQHLVNEAIRERPAMSKIYDRACTTCGHKINDHDANECWKTVDGKQCHCPWMGAEGAAA